MMEYFTILIFQIYTFCVKCLKVKLTSKARQDKRPRYGYVLELIHTDNCGCFTLSTLGGYIYFITFINDFSRYGYVELIHEKSDALAAFKDFKMKM